MNTTHKRIFATLILTVSLPATHSAFAEPGGERHGQQLRHFEPHDMAYWRDGRWRHGWHEGHVGWWWVVGGLWYFYPSPVYPYPDPYTPPVVVDQSPPTVIIQSAPPSPAAPPNASASPPNMPPPQVWYYCEASKTYYPYVASCPTGWKQVPAAPSDAMQR